MNRSGPAAGGPTGTATAGPGVGVLRLQLLGLAGTVAMAVSATAVGDLPATGALGGWPRFLWPAGRPWPAAALTYFGLTLLSGAWLLLRRSLRDHPDPLRAVLRTAALWAVPLLVAPPLQSRDVYSYLAQGEMFARGIDPYRSGPAALGGPLAANVSPIWQHAAAPYGPVFLVVAAAVMTLTSAHVVLAVIGMRLAMTAALAGTAACVVALARRYRVDPADAVLLAVLNPLTLVHVVSGAHNDILIIALTCAGILLADRGRPFPAAVVIGLAVLVKVTAVLALPVIVPAAARRLRSGRPGSRTGTARAAGPVDLAAGAAAVGAVAGLTVLAVTAAMGTWYGWVAALQDTARVRNGLSLTTDLGMVLDAALHLVGFRAADTVPTVRALGLVAAGVLILVTLVRTRGRPLYAFGLMMSVLVLLSPVLHPWYVLWGLVPLAACAPQRWLRRTAAWGSVGLVLYPMPWGEGFTPDLPLAALGAVAALAVLALLGRPRSGAGAPTTGPGGTQAPTTGTGGTGAGATGAGMTGTGTPVTGPAGAAAGPGTGAGPGLPQEVGGV